MTALAMTLDPFAAANAVRVERKKLLDELRKAADKAEALTRCAELLLACEPAVEGVSLFDLVRQCRYVGRDGARRLLVEAQITDPNASVASTRIRDAQRLAGVLRDAGARVTASRQRRSR